MTTPRSRAARVAVLAAAGTLASSAQAGAAEGITIQAPRYETVPGGALVAVVGRAFAADPDGCPSQITNWPFHGDTCKGMNTTLYEWPDPGDNAAKIFHDSRPGPGPSPVNSATVTGTCNNAIGTYWQTFFRQEVTETYPSTTNPLIPNVHEWTDRRYAESFLAPCDIPGK